jgi:hypothetical protein
MFALRDGISHKTFFGGIQVLKTLQRMNISVHTSSKNISTITILESYRHSSTSTSPTSVKRTLRQDLGSSPSQTFGNEMFLADIRMRFFFCLKPARLLLLGVQKFGSHATEHKRLGEVNQFPLSRGDISLLLRGVLVKDGGHRHSFGTRLGLREHRDIDELMFARCAMDLEEKGAGRDRARRYHAERGS